MELPILKKSKDIKKFQITYLFLKKYDLLSIEDKYNIDNKNEAFFDYTETNRTILQSSGAIRDMVEAEYIVRIIHTQRKLFCNNISEFYSTMTLVSNYHGVGYNPFI